MSLGPPKDIGFKARTQSLIHVLMCMSVFIALLAPAAVCRASTDEQETPLNVLLITVDALRPDHMSVYGYEKDTTPHLKAFAKEAVVFDNAFATSAWTMPGVVSMFTGYYPSVHAQSGRFSFYDREMTSALRVLAARGYEIFGYHIKGPSHEDFGFQRKVGNLENFVEARRDSERPFFAWAHIKTTHLPYKPAWEKAKQFGATGTSSEGIEAVKNYWVILRHPSRVNVSIRHPGQVTFTDGDVAEVRSLYDGEVAEVDEQLNTVLTKMRESGLLERTVVVISADHGEELFEHGWIGHASTSYDGKLYDELIRIPLLIRIPHLLTNKKISALVQGVDIMPTLFDILGVENIGMTPPMQGHSFLPVITGQQETIRDFVFTETTLKGWTTPKDELDIRAVSARSLTHKLIKIPSDNGWISEGYDLTTDPAETRNIYSEHPSVFVPLEQALRRWSEVNSDAAAILVFDGAQKRLSAMADVALRSDSEKLSSVVKDWLAIQTMDETWGLGPNVFYERERYAVQWQNIKRLATEMVGTAMMCDVEGGYLQTKKNEDPLSTDSWLCSPSAAGD